MAEMTIRYKLKTGGEVEATTYTRIAQLPYACTKEQSSCVENHREGFMSTITRRDIIAEMLENEGRYSDDPIPATVWSYWSTLAECRQWAVFYTWTHDMHTAPHVVDPVLLMEDGEITDAGRRWLDDEEQDGGGREEGGRSCSSRG